jgi:hypothetical protein
MADRYIESLPFGNAATPRLLDDDSEDAGDAIQHWREDAVEIDPLPETGIDDALDVSATADEVQEESTAEALISNLSPADAHAFYTNGELSADRDATAAEIKQICGTLNDHIDSFTAPRNATDLSENLIDSFLCMLTRLRREPIAVVRSAYTNVYHSDRVPKSALRASQYSYGDVENAPFVLIPIRKYYTSTQRVLNDNVPHHMLGVFFKASGTLFHFDSLGTPASKEDKEHYRHAVNTLLQHGHIKCRRIVKRPACHYNQQSSMRLSALYTLLTAELILLRGFDRTYLKRLANPRFATMELQEQVLRVVYHLRSLASAVFPCYKAPPRSQHKAPDVQPINFLLENARRMFVFTGNTRPQIVEDQPDRLIPIGRCADQHPHSGCFAMDLNHKIDPFVPTGFTKKCPHCDAWLT